MIVPAASFDVQQGRGHGRDAEQEEKKVHSRSPEEIRY
jgi:hypothetical protein